MKKIVSLILFVMSLTIVAFAMVGCTGQKEKVSPRSFMGQYTKDELCADVLLSLNEDGVATVYVGYRTNEKYEKITYTGSWKSGTNDDGDETVSITYSAGDTDFTISEAVISNQFKSSVYLIDGISEYEVTFYELLYLEPKDNAYIGHYVKDGVMGGSVAYGYAINLYSDGKFDVSIVQSTPFGSVFGIESGTYVIDGSKITFIYNVLADNDEDGYAEDVTVEDGTNFVSEGSDYTSNGFKVGFNINQVMMKASDAEFIKIK